MQSCPSSWLKVTTNFILKHILGIMVNTYGGTSSLVVDEARPLRSKRDEHKANEKPEGLVRLHAEFVCHILLARRCGYFASPLVFLRLVFQRMLACSPFLPFETIGDRKLRRACAPATDDNLPPVLSATNTMDGSPTDHGHVKKKKLWGTESQVAVFFKEHLLRGNCLQERTT